MTATAPEKLEFKTELKQLLHLITHSLYSHREIFLRELISNSSDAINKVRFDALSHEDRLENNTEWKIRLTPDADAGTLTVSDNGIGMDRAAVVENLGTIARSGTKVFLENLRRQETKDRPELIGQFGVGFYSSFMVADKVTVLTRQAGSPADAVRWESDGQGDYTVEPAEKEARGTDVILHLKGDAKEFLSEWTLRDLVRKFSDFLEHPVVLETTTADDAGVKTAKEDVLNRRTALWLRPKNEITSEEYAEFYKTISHDTEGPGRVLHYAAEGSLEYKALLFIPAHRPMATQWDEGKGGLRLYVQRVLIMEQSEELLPPYLRFVKGVVDCADLPLNISRELLQQNPTLEKIQRNVVGNVLSGLAAMQNVDYDKYVMFFRGLGPILKEGLGRDWANREKLADLMLWQSLNTPAGEFTTFEKYAAAMPEGQTEIIYIAGESREEAAHSPHLEAYRAKGYDVLLLTDPVDEFVIPSLGEYKGKRLRAADRGDAPAAADAPAEADQQWKPFLAALKGQLTEVGDVRLSQRLTESAACLVADAGAMSAHMERLLEKMGRDGTDAPKRVLELNPKHPAVEAVRRLFERDPGDARVGEYGKLFLDQSLLAEGSKIKDVTAFARRINALLVKESAV